MFGILGSFNRNFYRGVVNQSLRKSLGFLIVFVAVFSIILSCKHTLKIKDALPGIEVWAEENLEYFIYELPTIEIRDGALSLPQEPYVKEWEGAFAFLIEPEQEDFYALVEDYPSAVVLTKNQMIIKTTQPKRDQSKIETHDFGNIKFLRIDSTDRGLRISLKEREFNITPATIRRLFKRIELFLFPAIFLWLFSVYIFIKPLQILVFGLVAQIANSYLKKGLSYKQLLNIATYALVPPVSLAVVKDLLNFRMPLFCLAYVLVYIVYIFLGIESAHK